MRFCQRANQNLPFCTYPAALQMNTAVSGSSSTNSTGWQENAPLQSRCRRATHIPVTHSPDTTVPSLSGTDREWRALCTTQIFRTTVPPFPVKIYSSAIFSNVLFSSSYISDLLCQLIQLVLHQCICNNSKSKNLENQIQNTAVA